MAMAVIAVTIGAAGYFAISQRSPTAVFCRSHQLTGMTVRIDLDANQGVWEDVQMPLQTCDDQNVACMSFPLLIAPPPQDDWAGHTPLEWDVGSVSFQLDRSDNGTFFLFAQNETVAIRYVYDKEIGLTNFTFGTEAEDQWRICRGRLTFEDIGDWWEANQSD
jgi:hypothetical protein